MVEEGGGGKGAYVVPRFVRSHTAFTRNRASEDANGERQHSSTTAVDEKAALQVPSPSQPIVEVLGCTN